MLLNLARVLESCSIAYLQSLNITIYLSTEFPWTISVRDERIANSSACSTVEWPGSFQERVVTLFEDIMHAAAPTSETNFDPSVYTEIVEPEMLSRESIHGGKSLSYQRDNVSIFIRGSLFKMGFIRAIAVGEKQISLRLRYREHVSSITFRSTGRILVITRSANVEVFLNALAMHKVMRR